MTEGAEMTEPNTTSDRYAAFDRYAAEHMAAWTDELAAYCAIGSEASDPNALREAALWTAERLKRLGAAVDMVELDGQSRGQGDGQSQRRPVPPLVVGEIGAGRTLN